MHEHPLHEGSVRVRTFQDFGGEYKPVRIYVLTMTRDTSDPLDVASKFDPAAGRLSIDSGQKVSSEPGCFSNAGRIGSMLGRQTRWRAAQPPALGVRAPRQPE